jgi:hypothetical protein
VTLLKDWYRKGLHPGFGMSKQSACRLRGSVVHMDNGPRLGIERLDQTLSLSSRRTQSRERQLPFCSVLALEVDKQ